MKENFVFKELNSTEIEKKGEVLLLLNQVFNLGFDVIDFQVYTQASKRYEPLFIGAFFENRLVAFNGFIPMEMLLNNQDLLLYQSCWSAVDKEFRGKGLFSSLIQKGIDILSQRDVGGILGFPNELSYPLFIGKLGFQDLGGFFHSPLLFPSRFAKQYIFKKELPHREKGLWAHPKGLFNWKKEVHESSLLASSDRYGNLMWGKEKKLGKWGMSFRSALIGGISIEESTYFLKLLNQFANEHHQQVVSFIFPRNSDWSQFFRLKKESQMGRIIYYPLSTELPQEEALNFFVGMLDTF